MTLHRFFERLIWLCMLPLMALGVVLVATQLHILEARRSSVEQSLARSAARTIDELLAVQLSSLELLARTIDEQGVDPQGRLSAAKARPLAQHYLDLHGQHIVIGFADGPTLLNTRVPQGSPMPPMPQVNGRSALSMALASGSRAVGDVFIGQMTQRAMVALAVPLRPRQSEYPVLLSTLELAQIQQRIEHYSLPPTWTLTLRDSTGQAMTRLAAAESPPWWAGLLGQDERVRVSLTQSPWSVELHAPATSFLANSRVQAALLLITLVATIGLAYWAGRLASRRLTQALASLTALSREPAHAQDIAEVRQLREQMLQLQLERQEAQQRERQRIGLELHDDLQQRLAVLRQDVESMQQQAPVEPAKAVSSQAILKRIDDTIAATRHLVNDLRPPVLDEFGVAQGLRLLTQQLRKAHGLNIDLHVMAEERAEHLPRPVATALYRVTQEALNNVHKHAQASSVHVTLDLREDDAASLEIVDDGAGFAVLSGDAPESHGLRGMLERVQALRGTLKIESQPGEGTAIAVRLPIAKPVEVPEPAAKTGQAAS